MKIRRVFFLSSSLWELLRFLLLFLAAGVTFRRVLLTDSQAVFWLVLLASPGLLIPAGLLLLYLDAPRFRVLLNLLRLGKLLGLFSALLLIILEPFGTGTQSITLRILPGSIAPLSILLFTAVMDLIVLFLLFSYRQEPISEDPEEGQESKERHLPQYRENMIEQPGERHEDLT